MSFILLWLFLGGVVNAEASESFFEEFPVLEKYKYSQPETGLFLGFGLAPVSIMNQKPDLSFSLFQLHWLTRYFDFEIFNGTVGFTYLNNSNSYTLNHYTFRSSFQIRLSQFLSVGPLVGFELVSFPGVTAVTVKNGYSTPDQSFSATGFIYGAIVSELVGVTPGLKLLISECVYAQNYSTTTTAQGWQYVYDASSLNSSQTSIAPGVVYQLGFSLLY